MKKLLLAILVSGFAILVNCKQKKVIMTYDGGEITEDEVKKVGGRNLYQAEMRIYQMKMQVARQIIQEKVTELEQDATGKSIEILEQEYLANNYQAPSDEALKSYFNQNSDRSAASAPDEFLAFKARALQQAPQQALQKFYSDLLTKYDMKPVAAEPEKPEFARVKVDLDDDPYWGKEDARVVVVEFSDFECPYCRKMQEPIRKIKKEYSDKIKWVFRDYPLPFHKNAKRAHIAANCAGRQNKYFDYSSDLFDTEDLSEPNLNRIAQKQGLSMGTFKQCLADQNQVESNEIEKDTQYAQKIGVNGTPTLFINGELTSGLMSYEDLKRSIDHELQ